MVFALSEKMRRRGKKEERKEERIMFERDIDFCNTFFVFSIPLLFDFITLHHHININPKLLSIIDIDSALYHYECSDPKLFLAHEEDYPKRSNELITSHPKWNTITCFTCSETNQELSS